MVTDSQKELLLDYIFNSMNEVGREAIIRKAIELIWAEHPKKLSADWEEFITMLNRGEINDE